MNLKTPEEAFHWVASAEVEPFSPITPGPYIVIYVVEDVGGCDGLCCCTTKLAYFESYQEASGFADDLNINWLAQIVAVNDLRDYKQESQT